MTFKVHRKVGASDVFLKILQPLSNSTMLSVNQTGILDIKNDYNAVANDWVFNCSFIVDPRDMSQVGTWTFILEVYDFGTVSLAGTQTEVNGTNALSSINFLSTDRTRSFARACAEVNIGINPQNMLSITSITGNSSQIVPAGNDYNLTVNMSDTTAGANYGIYNTTIFPDEQNLSPSKL